MKNCLKTGNDILNPNWPRARWNVSGLFIHDMMLQGILSLSISRFNCRFIESVHGSPPVRWNSGRIQNTTLDQKNLAASFINTLQTYKDLGVNVIFTFSNSLLEKEHLNDQTCNFMLQKLAEIHGENGGVILSSELLSRYIREKYPELKQIASVVKVTMEDGKGKSEYYKSIEERYDKFVVHPDDNFNPGLLSQLNPHKAELLVNEPCLLDCPTRKRHYILYSEASKYLKPSLEELREFEVNTCKSVPFYKQLFCPEPRMRNCNLTVSELKALYDMGFREFKLQGRTDSQAVFRYDLTRYIFEPEHIAPLMFKVVIPEGAQK